LSKVAALKNSEPPGVVKTAPAVDRQTD